MTAHLRITAAVLFLAPLYILSAQQHGTLSGEVRDAVTRQPLPGATVTVAGTALGAAANDEGYFRIDGVPAGRHSVRASVIGYEAVTTAEVTVHPLRNTTANFRLTASAVELDAVDVRTEYFARPAENAVSVRTLSPEEIRRSPGSAEDIFRVMQSMPGVATAGGKSAQLIVRGGSPDENLTLLDNVEIYNPIHFARSGESMGIISIINPSLLENVDFLTGAFPARYGDRLSSVFDMTMKDGNRETFNTDVNVNIAGFGTMLDGPLSGNSRMVFSVRRGFFDILTSIMDRPAAPQYYDAVGKVTVDLDPDNRLSIVGFYYIDQIEKEGTTKESSAMTKYEVLSRDDYGSAFGLTWRSLVARDAFITTTLSFTGNGWSTRQGTLTDRELRGEDILENELTLKSESVWQLNPAFEASAGFTVKAVDSRNESWLPADTSRTGIITPAGTITFLPSMEWKNGLYGQLVVRPLPSLTLTGGLRADHFTMTGETTISPRLAGTWRITGTTSLNAAWGLYAQTPQSYQIAPDPRNAALRSASARHAVLGLEHRVGDDTKATLEVYRKDLEDVIVAPDSSHLLVNTGSGFAQGIELSVQRKFTEGFVGSASYSYSTSQRRDTPDGPLYDFEFDRPHIVNLIGGMELGNGWQVGAKFMFASGNPYTPPDGTVLRGGVYYILDGPLNSARYPDYHKIDLRVDKQWILTGWSITAYIDLWNVYNRDNIISYSYKADTAGNITRTARYDFGITPILGVTAKF